VILQGLNLKTVGLVVGRGSGKSKVLEISSLLSTATMPLPNSNKKDAAS